MEIIERMGGDVDGYLCVVFVEVGHDEQQLIFVLAQESVVAVGIEVGCEGIGIHEVEEVAFTDGTLVAGDMEQMGILTLQVALAVVELASREGATIAPTTYSIDTPIVEDGGASVAATEALGIHATLAQLLAEVDHHGAGVDGGAHKYGRQGRTAVAGDEVGGEALLIVVFHEVEHAIAQFAQILPATRNVGSRLLMADDADEGVVEAYLIVQVVEPTVLDVVVVFPRIVYFGNEDDMGVFLLDDRYHPAPELEGYHLGHIATETVNTLLGPEEEDVAHLEPGGGEGVEVGASTLAVVDTVVELYGLVPVVACGVSVKAVITGGAGRAFHIVLPVDLSAKRGAGKVIKIILGREEYAGIVLLTEVYHALGLGIGVVAACHVVGNEVDNHLQSCSVGSLHQLGELLHAVGHGGGQVGVYVVVVLDGIGRTCLTFHRGLVVGADAEMAVVGLRGMLDKAGVPYVGGAQLLDGSKSLGGEGG